MRALRNHYRVCSRLVRERLCSYRLKNSLPSWGGREILSSNFSTRKLVYERPRVVCIIRSHQKSRDCKRCNWGCVGDLKKRKKTCTRARVQCMGTFHLKIERALCSPVLKVRLYYINESSICFSGRESEINFCANFRTKEWYGLFPGIILDDEVISQKFYFEINSFAFSQRQLYEKGFWENMLETCFVIRSHNTLLKKNV